MEEKESFDQQKIKFQTMITLQNQQMVELKEKLEKTNNEKDNSASTSRKEELELLTKFNLFLIIF